MHGVVCRGTQRYTEVCRVVHEGVRRDAQRYVEVHGGVRKVLGGAWRYAEVCRGAQRYAEVSGGAQRYV